MLLEGPFADSGRSLLRLPAGLRGALEHRDDGLEPPHRLRPGHARGERWPGTPRERGLLFSMFQSMSS